MTDVEYVVTTAAWLAGYMAVACVVMYVGVRSGYDEGVMLWWSMLWPVLVCMTALGAPLAMAARLARRHRKGDR